MTCCPHCGKTIGSTRRPLQNSLTLRQLELFDFIKSYTAETGGVGPSYDEMADHLGLASKSSVNRLLNGLEERGAIRRIHNHARTVSIVEASL